jgi:predicted DNA-binding WGR domain protein
VPTDPPPDPSTEVVPHSTPEPPAAPAEETGDRWTEYLEFVGGGSSKFWEISVNGSEQTVRFGRIGSRGQGVTKAFADRAAALADAQRQAEGKRRKGYGPKGPAT